MEKKTYEETTFLGQKARKLPLQPLTSTIPKEIAAEKPSNDLKEFWEYSSKKKPISYIYGTAKYPCLKSFHLSSEIHYGLPAALLVAYKYHADAVISPDDIWLTALIGLGKHVNLDPEKYRKHFVAHEGKKRVGITRTEPFEAISWEDVVAHFGDEIKKHAKTEFLEKALCNFITSSRIEQLASMVAVMGSMKHYFNFSIVMGSGLRNIYFLGAEEDWIKLRAKIESLAKFDLDEWTKRLLFVVDHFIEAYKGKVDLGFWNHMVDKVDGIGASGQRTKDSDYTGWIINFYPYTEKEKPVEKAMKAEDFPPLIVGAPVTLKDSAAEHHMKFMAGYSGMCYTSEAFYPQLSIAFAEKKAGPGVIEFAE